MGDSDSLKSRLAILRSLRNPALMMENPPPRKPSTPLTLEGWEQAGNAVWQRKLSEPAGIPDSRDPDAILPELRPEALRFFDLETTGLSGGAGTVAFLAGVGLFEGEKAVVYQVFLADFPGEREFLQILQGLLPEESLLVSYNGKSFDLPLWRTRCLMQGLPWAPPREHLDLLFLSRRLFRPLLGTCSLGDLESQILGIPRDNDVPGFLVPEVYFSFLKTGDRTELNRVFRHNEQDILSLVSLLRHLTLLLDHPCSADKVDRAGLGRLLLLNGHPEAEGFLRNALEAGDRKAGSVLAFHLKRAGRYDEADHTWRIIMESSADLASAEERAKHLEHRKKNPEEALKVLNEALLFSGVDANENPWILHRIRRLERKISRETGRVSPGTL
ncbi:MAG: ribonuclease H-like domain-containing protein [Spirochaetales bacterium]|nr:ribonuclease H-like domain-containing protein [Spirochaetales bacterium]